MFDSIIPIGETCNTTFLLQNAKLKKMTTLFEYFRSPSLKDITDVLIKIANHTDHDLLHEKESQLFMGDHIYSSHYSLNTYREIYDRRRNRLIETIMNSKKILFCRFETISVDHTQEDIDLFISTIHSIHKELEIKILFITPGFGLEHPNIFKVFYDKVSSDPYCTSSEINDLFVNTLQELGYDLSDTTEEIFHDKSDF